MQSARQQRGALLAGRPVLGRVVSGGEAGPGCAPPPLQLSHEPFLCLPKLQDDLFKAVQLPGRHQCLAAVHTALGAGALATAADARGWPVLHCAAGANPDGQAAASAVAKLVAQGADVNVRSQGGRNPIALHRAARNPSGAAAAAIIRALADLGADVRIKDGANGDEPLVSPAASLSCAAGLRTAKEMSPCAACFDSTAAHLLFVLLQVPLLPAEHPCRRWPECATRYQPNPTSLASVLPPLQRWIAFQTNTEAVPAVTEALLAAGARVNAKSSDVASVLVSRAALLCCAWTSERASAMPLSRVLLLPL